MPEIKCEMDLSLDTILLLKKMCKEDNISATAEIENAISGWYRFRHGYTGLATLDPYMIVHEDGSGVVAFKEGRNG